MTKEAKNLLPDIESPCTLSFNGTVKMTHRLPPSGTPAVGCSSLSAVVDYLADKCLEAEGEIQATVENGAFDPNSQHDRMKHLKYALIAEALEAVGLKSPQGLLPDEVTQMVYRASEMRNAQSMKNELARRLRNLDPYLRVDLYADETDKVRWKAVRATPPAGASPYNVYFIAWVPMEKSWPSPFEAPPIKVDIPFPEGLAETGDIASCINGGKMGFQVRVHCRPDPATTQMEMGSVCLAATAAPDSDLATRWAYAQKFDPASIPKDSAIRTVNFHERFPAIGRLTFRDDEKPQKHLFDKLRAVPAGIAMYTGGPGSGKTTFAARIAAAVAEGGDKVMWTIHSNELCDDAVKSLKEQKVEKPDGTKIRVGRLPTWARMKKAISQAAHTAAKSLAASKGKMTDASAGRTVASHINIFLSHMNRGLHERTIRVLPDSVTERAIAIARDNEEFFMGFCTSQPGSAEWNGTFSRLISLAVDDFDILVGTPFAAGQLGRKASADLARPDLYWKPWEPSLLVVDEAGRIPEAQWWIPLSVFPNACVLTMGDTRQFKPLAMSVSEDTHRGDFRNSRTRTGGLSWRCVFGVQRTVSLLGRAESNSQLLGHLSNNRRNRGDIANWAKKHIYPGEMRIVYPLPENQSALIYLNFMRWIFPKSQVDSNALTIDVRHTASRKHNLSSVNQGNRNLVWWLVYMAFQYKLPNLRSEGALADIMIVTPYSAQHGLYKDDIMDMRGNSIIKSKVTLRTIDNAMSAEADLVIFDSVRTEGGIGFLDDRERMAVATTRARGGAVTLFNSSNIKATQARGGSLDNPFASYVLSHKTRVVSHGHWSVMCDVCNLPHTKSTECMRARCCRKCRGPHHERFCARGTPAVDSYDKLNGPDEMKPAAGAVLD
ncbi:Helicase sen1 [Colletotrichum tanaceti]|uniref:Helicase sen1 n=1 Tax=Colletotrichum tanaceti TaxID=1306861 RepID=A0A4U6XEW2_9PEZI|nr:Helicase sen1 [Colletotrichum tanaceti]TKW54235.1 Helicase sen1 [Colletotrichum tanaceti]